jgi:hypothetical protein
MVVIIIKKIIVKRNIRWEMRMRDDVSKKVKEWMMDDVGIIFLRNIV